MFIICLNVHVDPNLLDMIIYHIFVMKVNTISSKYM